MVIRQTAGKRLASSYFSRSKFCAKGELVPAAESVQHDLGLCQAFVQLPAVAGCAFRSFTAQTARVLGATPYQHSVGLSPLALKECASL